MKKPMFNKSTGIKHFIDTIFPGTLKSIEKGECPICKQKITDFRDYKSVREYEISGLCQECQDATFGV